MIWLLCRILANVRFRGELTKFVHRWRVLLRHEVEPIGFDRRCTAADDAHMRTVSDIISAANFRVPVLPPWRGSSDANSQLATIACGAQTYISCRPIGSTIFDLKAPELLRFLQACGAVEILPPRRGAKHGVVRYRRTEPSAKSSEQALAVCGRGVRNAVVAAVCSRMLSDRQYCVGETASARSLNQGDYSGYWHSCNWVQMGLLAASQRLAFMQGFHHRLGQHTVLSFLDDRSIADEFGRYIQVGGIERHNGTLSNSVVVKPDCWELPLRSWQLSLVDRWAAEGGGYELTRLMCGLERERIWSCAPLTTKMCRLRNRDWSEPINARICDIVAVMRAAASALRRLSAKDRPKTEVSLQHWLQTWLRTTRTAEIFDTGLEFVAMVMKTEALTRAARRTGCTWWQ
eukprot:SAG31_NODE_550_length_14214_cov_3.054269_5_plen_403_part_00